MEKQQCKWKEAAVPCGCSFLFQMRGSRIWYGQNCSDTQPGRQEIMLALYISENQGNLAYQHQPQDSISRIFWLHFCAVGGRVGRSSIFIYILWYSERYMMSYKRATLRESGVVNKWQLLKVRWRNTFPLFIQQHLRCHVSILSQTRMFFSNPNNVVLLRKC